MDQNRKQEEKKKFIFWLYIDDLHKYEDKVFLSFKKHEKKLFQLKKSDHHNDIFYVQLFQEELKMEHLTIKYCYKIIAGNTYQTSEIARQFSYRQMNQNLNEIFDTPEKFVEKSLKKQVVSFLSLGFASNEFISQKNKDESLLNFISNKVSMQHLMNLKLFINYCNFDKLLPKYYEKSILCVIDILLSEKLYEHDIEDFFEYYKYLNYQVKIKYADAYVIALSQYFSKYSQNSELSIKNKLKVMYNQSTTLQQRINILSSEYCILSEYDAEMVIGKNDYNNELASNPQYYIDLFQKPSKYPNLFKNQIIRIIELASQNQKESLINFLLKNKYFLDGFNMKVKQDIKVSIFSMKQLYSDTLKLKCIDLLKNYDDIKIIFNIPYFESRNLIKDILNNLKKCYFLKNEDIKHVLRVIMDYQIDLYEYQSLLSDYLDELKDDDKIHSFSEMIIEKNPFICIDKLLTLVFDKRTTPIVYHYIPSYFKMRQTHLNIFQKVYEKQQEILIERKEQKDREQRNGQIKQNKIEDVHVDVVGAGATHVAKKIKQESDNQWDNDILSDQSIKKDKFNNKGKEAIPSNISIEKVDEEEESKRKQKFQDEQQMNIKLNKEEFQRILDEKLETIIQKTDIPSLYKILDSTDFTKQDQQHFKIILQKKIYIKIKQESTTNELFIKNYLSVKNTNPNNYSKDILIALNFFDQFAIEKTQDLINSGDAFLQFNSQFIYTFLQVCDKQNVFYKTLQEQVKQINTKILTKNINMNQFNNLFSKQFVLQIFKIFDYDLQYQKKDLDYWLSQCDTKIDNYQIFFNRFQEFFPSYHELLNQYSMKNLIFCNINDFILQFSQYEGLAYYYIELSKSQVFISILQVLLNLQIQQTQVSIQNLQSIQDIQPNEQNTQALLNQRMTNFTDLMLSLINNLFDFSNLIFDAQQGQIINLDKFNEFIQSCLGSYIQQKNNQKLQAQQQLQQNHFQQQLIQVFQNNQQLQQNNQQVQQVLDIEQQRLFNEQSSIEDLKPYCGQNLNELIENIKQFWKVFNIQADIKMIEQNMKKCFMTLFYLETSNLIKKVGDIVQANWSLESNHQLENLFDTLSKIQDAKKQPLKEMMKLEISTEIIQEFECILKLKNIERNMQYFNRSQSIIKQTDINKQKGLTYLDMRDFIGDNEYDLSSFLTVLNEFSPFFTELSVLKNSIISNGSNSSVLQAIISINNLIESKIKTDQKVLQWDEIIKNFHKIASIESSIDKKKSYLNLLKKMYQVGKTTIKIAQNNEQATFIIECDDKCYSEQEIREISSRVLIEKHSINAIFSQQDQNAQKQMSENGQEMDGIQLPYGQNSGDKEKLIQKQLATEQKMENFKKQLELTQDLKQILQDMSDYGYFLFNQKEYIYNNKDNMYQRNMDKMKLNLSEFKDQLSKWKSQIQIITQSYPKFSFVSYSFYSDLDKFLLKILAQEELHESILQIVQNQIGANSFEIKSLKTAFQEYKTIDNKLLYIGNYYFEQSNYFFYILIFNYFKLLKIKY